MQKKIFPTPNEQIIEAAELINQTAAEWPCKWVTRRDARVFSGGLISAQTLANLDSNPDKEGPKGAFILGQTICYPVDKFAEFLIKRLRTTPGNQPPQKPKAAD